MPDFTRRELEPTVIAISDMLRATAPVHCIIGGVAVMHYARRASTADVDFLVAWKDGERDALIALAERRGWTVEHRSDWQLRLFGPDTYADVVSAQVPLEVEAAALASEVRTDMGVVRVAPLEHLVALKAVAGRSRDLWDLAMLYEMHPDLDVDRINRWIEPFDVKWEPERP